MNIIDDKDYYERDQIGENDEASVNNDIKVLKLGKLISQKNLGNIEKESDKINKMDIIDDNARHVVTVYTTADRPVGVS